MLPIANGPSSLTNSNAPPPGEKEKAAQRLDQGAFLKESIKLSKPKCHRMIENSLSLRNPNNNLPSRIKNTISPICVPQISNPSLSNPVKINTSNLGKFSEFVRLFNQHQLKLEATHLDIDEIDADPVSVVVHKASQLPEGCLVEDTSLDISGEAVGVNVRWLSQDLPKYIGKPAVWRTLLACRQEETVSVYQGEVFGKIVAPVGNQGFGFDPYFLPDGKSKTLAQDKSDSVNARAKAVNAFCQQQRLLTCSPILNWQGAWQVHEAK